MTFASSSLVARAGLTWHDGIMSRCKTYISFRGLRSFVLHIVLKNPVPKHV